MSSDQIVPKSWSIVPLSEILSTLESGSRPKGGVKGISQGIPSLGGEHLDGSGGFRFENIRYVPKAFADRMTRGHLLKGDVLVVKDGATTGKASFIGDDFPFSHAVVNEHVFLCRCAPHIVSKYIFFYLFSERGNSQILEDFRGAAQGGISQRFADIVRVPIAPVAEQTRIVTKLEDLISDLDTGVAELKAAQKKLGQYRQSLLKAAVEGALTADWRAKNPPSETGAQLLERITQERRARWEAKQLANFAEQGKTPPKDWQKKYPEPVQLNTTGLPELPEGWVWASLHQVLDDSLIGLDRGQDQQSASAAFGYIKMNNVSMTGAINLENLVRVDASIQEVEKYSVVRGDILFNTRNSVELVGKVGLVHSLSGTTLFNNNLMRLRFGGAVLPEFVCWQMCGPEFRSRMERVKKATTSVAAVYAKDLFPLVVVVAPLDEQAEILRSLGLALAGLEAQELAITFAFKQSTAQRQNILRAAFAGELVPQDPNDEPASVLLERIRAERAAATLAQPTRKRRGRSAEEVT